MTALQIATLLHAQSAGSRRWLACCPAHRDSTPSLSICEGDDGRVLIHCFAGCTTDDILTALNLHRRDLFIGSQPNPAQIEAMRIAREAREQAAYVERQTRLAAIRKSEKLQAIVNALGASLARNPEDHALAALFHRTCDQLHSAEATVDALYTIMRPDTTQHRRSA